jgi:signal transduction histidine kinase
MSGGDMGSDDHITGLGPVSHYGFGVLAVGGATWLAMQLARSPALLFAMAPFGLAVALAVWVGGFGPGFAAAILSLAAIDLFVIDPGSLFTLQSPTLALAWGAHGCAWLGFCVLAGRIHRSAEHAKARGLDAERSATQADRLAQLTAAFAQARTSAGAIDAAVQEPLHAFKGDAGLLLLVSSEGGPLEIARAVGYQDEQREARVASCASAKSPASDAIACGAPIILASPEAYAREYPAEARAGAPASVASVAAVPIILGSRVLAVVQLEFRQPRVWSAEDREYLLALSARAAQALDRTFQLESALRARVEADALRERADQELAERQKVEQALRASETRLRTLAARTGRLHELASALSGAATLDAVARAVVHHGRNVLGATNGEVWRLLDGGSQFETLFSDLPQQDPRHLPRLVDADPGLCATHAVRTRQPVFVASFEEWQERYSTSAALAADGGYVSSATLPIIVDGSPTGVLGFHFTAPVNFDEEYQALLVSVAQHCAQALERARQYEAAQKARAEAETANRLKDEFVSIVSHELRTPLSAMLGWASMLEKGSLDAATAERAVRSIHDNATRQVRLVDELLDLSRLTSGRLTLVIEDVDLRSLLHGVVDSIIPSATAAGLELDVEAIPPVMLRGDARRLEQVFFNLLGNALKFTSRGGRVGLNVTVEPAEVQVRVCDTGAGIDPAFLPHMFDRFSQGDVTGERRYGGVGLGLAIAKELVEAHKGRIGAESPGAGRGSTFVVTLPLAVQREEPLPRADGSFVTSEETIH